MAGLCDKCCCVLAHTGNNKSDSCGVVPANVPETINVAASNMVRGGAGCPVA